MRGCPIDRRLVGGVLSMPEEANIERMFVDTSNYAGAWMSFPPPTRNAPASPDSTLVGSLVTPQAWAESVGWSLRATAKRFRRFQHKRPWFVAAGYPLPGRSRFTIRRLV